MGRRDARTDHQGRAVSEWEAGVLLVVLGSYLVFLFVSAWRGRM